ncbi:MAG: hypothetical protein UX16_C0021G0006 [Parcubacteria group bacterium GW2011_GWB1_45_7]|nr:MAG: hypothetical protein UX16_C0021G0006 [Parcubacteria group bacterium GW2011_GWB1_45_7]
MAIVILLHILSTSPIFICFVGDGGYLTSLVLLALSKPTVLNNFLHGENFPFPRPPFAFDISKNRRTSFTEVLLFCGRWRCRTSDLSDRGRTALAFVDSSGFCGRWRCRTSDLSDRGRTALAFVDSSGLEPLTFRM